MEFSHSDPDPQSSEGRDLLSDQHGTVQRQLVSSESQKIIQVILYVCVIVIPVLVVIVPLCVPAETPAPPAASAPTPAPPAAGAPTPSQDKFENCRKFTNVSQERLYHDDAVKFCEDMEATLLQESSIEDMETCGMMPEDEVWIDRGNHGGSDKNLCEVYKEGYWTDLDCATPRRFICKK